jgi:hypothetical protein
MISASTDTHPAAGASLIALLAGLWLFFSPWIYGAYGTPNAWNSWVTGALIFIFGVVRMNRPAATGLSWLNSILPKRDADGVVAEKSPTTKIVSATLARVAKKTVCSNTRPATCAWFLLYSLS